MAKLHHLTLKSAVLAYASFHIAGATDEEVKAEIAKDEKGFDAEQVNEIYAAIVAGNTPDDSNAGNTGNNGTNGDNQDSKQSKEPGKGPDTNAGNPEGKYIIVTSFRDINDFSVEHAPGKDVSHFDAKRLEGLLKNKLVELQS